MANNKQTLASIKKALKQDVDNGMTLLNGLKKHLYSIIKVKANNTNNSNITPEILGGYLASNQNFENDIIVGVINGKYTYSDAVDSISGILGGIINNIANVTIIHNTGLTEGDFNSAIDKLIAKYTTGANNNNVVVTDTVRKFISDSISNIGNIVSTINVLEDRDTLVKVITDVEQAIKDSNIISNNKIDEMYNAYKSLFDSFIYGTPNNVDKLNLFSAILEFVITLSPINGTTQPGYDETQISALVFLCLFYSRELDFDDFVGEYLLFDDDIWFLFGRTYKKGTEKILNNIKQMGNYEEKLLILYVIVSMIFGSIDLNNIDMSFKNINTLLYSIFIGPDFKFTFDEILNY